MARLESIAIGGFFATPQHLVPAIADVLDTSGIDSYQSIKIVDPCAGEGLAVDLLATLSGVKNEIYTCELEATRHKTLKEGTFRQNWQNAQRAIHGDAFMVELKPAMSVLYLNPPYDLDPVHGRLEERFLERYTGSLVEGGALVLVVPYYALKASAQTLALHYENLRCYRFPDEDFGAYKQAVLYGNKVDRRIAPNQLILRQVEEWAESTNGMPVLGEETKVVPVPQGEYLGRWELREFDLTGLINKARPWRYSSRPGQMTHTPHVLPDVPVEDLLFRTYPIATPPRPAHIAAGIASGLFNGRRVTPSTPGLPDLLVKGVFDREYKTIREKTDKHGDTIGVEQVQAPKLVTTVLDLTTKRYTTLKTSGKSGALIVEGMTIEDLLDHYGPSLMEVMNQQCPVLYDPKLESGVTLAPVARKLFTAQAHAARAVVKLLGGNGNIDRQYMSAILLGEIGCGKTSVALAVSKTIADRTLVMCPPHLLQSWVNEIQAVVPEADVRILSSVTDVDDIAAAPKGRPLIAILSRETGKLSHGWASVSGACPHCGVGLPDQDFAKKRECCEASTLRGNDFIAQAALELSYKLAPLATGFATSSDLRTVLRGRIWARYFDSIEGRDERPWHGLDTDWSEALADCLADLLEKSPYSDSLPKILGRLLVADYSPERIARIARRFAVMSDYRASEIARDLALLLDPDSDEQLLLMECKPTDRAYYSSSPWTYFRDTLKRIGEGVTTKFGSVKWIDGALTVNNHEPGSISMARWLLNTLSSKGSFSWSPTCGAPLFQATPEPRRYAVAKYIAKRHKKLFNFLVLDEGHEYSSDGAAQSISAHRLVALGMPVLLMTGSLMNGYAESLFTNMWSLSHEFRKEFARDEKQRFIDRYGYRKRVLTDKDKQTGEVKEFGSHSDRVERSEKVTGVAPGVLPLFLFRHLLTLSVTLHKADLALDLPKHHQMCEFVDPDKDVLAEYETLKRALIQAIHSDQFEEDRSGKLFGALADLPSYLDRATEDTGNQDDGSYEVRYPESLDRELVARAKPLPASKILAKEQWMLDKVEQQLEQGRNVMVFCWNVNLLPRLARLIRERIGEEVPVLYADKVSTGKRQEWIEKNVVKKGRRVLVVNPVAIQTGLNNLVHFSSIIWMQNPACNPVISRQADGRIDRIGKTKETYSFYPVYRNTLQQSLYDLLMRKIAISTSTDGLDPESALMAAGLCEDGYLSGLSIGKQIWAMIEDDFRGVRAA